MSYNFNSSKQKDCTIVFYNNNFKNNINIAIATIKLITNQLYSKYI